MNKAIEYKNIDVFIKEVFPNIYHGEKSVHDTSLKTFIEKESNDFRLKIDNIMNNKEKSNGA